MTLLGPLLIALFYGLIFYFVLNPNVGSKEKKIAVFDMNKNLFSKNVKFVDYVLYYFLLLVKAS